MSDFSGNIPIYLQIVNKIKIQIISGELKPGERLLSVRDLALTLQVNPNTVQKALSELEETLLIYTQRTNGKFVTEDKKLIEKYKNEFAENLTREYILNMNRLGLNKNNALQYLNSIKEEE